MSIEIVNIAGISNLNIIPAMKEINKIAKETNSTPESILLYILAENIREVKEAIEYLDQ